MGELNTFPTHPSAVPIHTPSHGGHASLLGGLENLGSDLSTAASGFFPGLVQSVEHPIRAGKTIVHSTWHDWSPLFHGHVGQWAHQTYDHPLAPLLDVASAFTLGDTALARVGAGLSKVAKEGSTAAKVGDALKGGSRQLVYQPSTKALAKAGIEASDPGAQTLIKTRATKATPMKRAIQQAIYDHVGHLPHWFGSNEAIYNRLVFKNNIARYAAHSENLGKAARAYAMQVHAFQQAGKSLHDSIREAAPMIFNHNYDQAVARPYALHDPYLRDSAGAPLRDPVTGALQYRPIPKGFLPIMGDTRALRAKLGAHDPTSSFEHRLEHLSEEITHSRDAYNSDPQAFLRRHATLAKDANGNIKLLHKDPFGDLMREGARSSKFLKYFYKYPTRAWKMAFVGMSPKMLVDNTVGNYMMYGARQFGHHAFQGIVDAVKQSRDLRKMNEMEKYLNPHWVNKHFADEINSHSMMGATLGETIDHGVRGVDTVAPTAFGKKIPNFYGAVHKISDQPVRRAALNAFMRGAPEVKAAMKSGLGFDQAVEKVLSSPEGEALRQRAIGHVRDIAGNYRDISHTEDIIKNISPFYLWQRHILRHVRNLGVDEPYKLAAMQRIAARGAAANSLALGPHPHFMDNMMPVGQQQPGHHQLLDTRGLSPYSSVGELANAAQALSIGHQQGTVGDAMSSISNPVAIGALEAATGHKVGSDAKVQTHGGVPSTFLWNMLQSTPEGQIITEAMHGGKIPPGRNAKGQAKVPIYNKDLKSFLTNMAGIPLKTTNDSAVAKAAAKEQGKKKGRGGYSVTALNHF